MALFKLTIEGIDRTMQVKQRLISLSMTDKRGMKQMSYPSHYLTMMRRYPYPLRVIKYDYGLRCQRQVT